MREEPRDRRVGSESPRHRSRSPINRDRSSPDEEKFPEQEPRDSPKEEAVETKVEGLELKSPFDSYSASLRLASMETLTGKPPTSLGLP